MTSVFISILLMSLVASLLILLLFFLRPLTAKRLSATWHYRMYIVVVFFLLVPVGFLGGSFFANMFSVNSQALPSVPAAINNMMTVQQTGILPQAPQNSPQPADTPASAPVAASAPAPAAPHFEIKTLLTFLPYIWLIGIIAFIVWYIANLFIFKKKILSNGFEVNTTTRQSFCRQIEKHMIQWF